MGDSTCFGSNLSKFKLGFIGLTGTYCYYFRVSCFFTTPTFVLKHRKVVFFVTEGTNYSVIFFRRWRHWECKSSSTTILNLSVGLVVLQNWRSHYTYIHRSFNNTGLFISLSSVLISTDNGKNKNRATEVQGIKSRRGNRFSGSLTMWTKVKREGWMVMIDEEGEGGDCQRTGDRVKESWKIFFLIYWTNSDYWHIIQGESLLEI